MEQRLGQHKASLGQALGPALELLVLELEALSLSFTVHTCLQLFWRGGNLKVGDVSFFHLKLNY